MAVMVKLVKTSSNLIPPEDDVSQYTEDEIRDRIFGSKLVLVVEQMQLVTIWLIKACLLIMYARMTAILPQHKIVVATAYYVGVTFVSILLLYISAGLMRRDRSSWKSSTLLYGVGRSTSTGQYLQTRVRVKHLLQHVIANMLRTMLGSNESPYHQRRFQYQQRCYNPLYPLASSIQSAASEEEQDCSLRNLPHWRIHHRRSGS